jgi:hypothetical protein
MLNVYRLPNGFINRLQSDCLFMKCKMKRFIFSKNATKISPFHAIATPLGFAYFCVIKIYKF